MKKVALRITTVCLSTAILACNGGLPVTANTPVVAGRDETVKLSARLNSALGPLTAERQEETGTIVIHYTPDATAETILSAAAGDIGPCVIDGYAYAYYVLRLFDKSGQFMAASIARERPIPCDGPRSFDFSAFKPTPHAVSFTANSQLLSEAASAEFGVLFDVFGHGAEGRLITDRSDVRPSWLERAPTTE